MAAIGDAWAKDAWIEAGWVTAPAPPGGAWSIAALAAKLKHEGLLRNVGRFMR